MEAIRSGLPRSWADVVRAASLSHRTDLPDDIDRAVASTDLGVHHGTGWWKLVTVVQLKRRTKT